LTDPSVTLESSICGVRLCPPLVLASGVMGVSAASMARMAALGAGAVTMKSCSIEPRAGHRNPCVLPFEHGMLNAVGLSNPGVDGAVEVVREYRARATAPLIASVFAGSVEEFGEVTRRIAAAAPDMIEVNVSCPNVHSEFGTPFGADRGATAAITRTVKAAAGNIPVAIKLTLNCPSIGHMAKVCEESGADAITAVNTAGPGMLIDVATRRPVLSNRMGGVSGGAIFPLALKAVFEIRTQSKLPIIATGGVSTGAQAAQMFLAGATAVAIGTGVHTRGITVFEQVARELSAWVASTPERALSALIGAAHG
jgi:dihydroorotate dehydrogenase (NAD+) catalytic subunit